MLGVSHRRKSEEKLGVPTYKRKTKTLKHRAVSAQEPVKKEDEDKRGGFKDTGGAIWWIGTKQC